MIIIMIIAILKSNNDDNSNNINHENSATDSCKNLLRLAAAGHRDAVEREGPRWGHPGPEAGGLAEPKNMHIIYIV